MYLEVSQGICRMDCRQLIQPYREFVLTRLCGECDWKYNGDMRRIRILITRACVPILSIEQNTFSYSDFREIQYI